MSTAPKIALSDDFLKSFAAIPRDKQQAVLKFVALFRQNPRATGINYETIHNAADSNMRSVRIDQALRGIILKPVSGDVYCLLWVDRHDDAYRWAATHRVAIHPDLGSIQVFAVEAVAESVPVPPRPPEAKGFFDSLKDREIRRMGVPEEALARVRAITTEDGLESLQATLPEDAFEALYLFAAGDSYDKIIADREAVPGVVDTEDFGKALDQDASRRHFVVITDDSDLDGLLAAPLERWRVFLHPSQRRMVDRDWNGPVRVLGGAGTGKTVVAMHRAAWLARKYRDMPGKPVLFTTFTRTLADDIRSHVASLCTPQEIEKIAVVNMDQWAISLLRRFGYQHELLYDDGRRREFWRLALTRAPGNCTFPAAFFRAEYERVILPNGCETGEDYMHASRLGRGGQLGRVQRKALWPVFAEYRAQLHAANLREPEEAFRDARVLLLKEKESLGIRSIIVDETQDMSAAALGLLRAAIPNAENDLFLVGDAHQRIYRHKVALSKVGIEVRGRSRRLRVNYRTTDEIRRWAVAQLEGCEVDDLDGELDTLKGYRSLTHGGMPEITSFSDAASEKTRLLAVLAELTGDNLDSSNVCLVCRTNEELEHYQSTLEAAGIKTLKLDRNTADDRSIVGIRLATMHRVKGLEFEVVIIVGYRSPDYYAEHFSRDEDAGVVSDSILNERCLLHVAATRAKRHLVCLLRR
jgi:superfamily I DNA/RNA helicase